MNKRYFRTFTIVILLMILFLIMEKTIPNEKSRRNLLKSEKLYHDYFDYQYSNINIIKDKHETVAIAGDLYHLSMIYLEDNKHPWKSFIEMNMDSKSSQRMENKESFRDFKIDSDYSRYWNGQLIVLKPLLSFFTISTIHNIYLSLFIIIFSILLFMLFKHSKLLAIIFTISSISMNTFFVTTSDDLFYIFVISMITSIIIIRMYERKSKNIDLLFLIVGILTVYFDNITCETLSLTLPMFIYIYLNYKNNKRLHFNNILKYIVLWLGGYTFSFLVKWILLTVHYHGHFIDKVFSPMIIRVYYKNENVFSIFFNTMKELPTYLYPFGYYSLKIFLLIMSVLSFIYIIISNKKIRNVYLCLFLISSIPLVRYFILSSHSNYHNFFTYRAYLPFAMFCFLNISFVIMKLVKNRNN